MTVVFWYTNILVLFYLLIPSCWRLLFSTCMVLSGATMYVSIKTSYQCIQTWKYHRSLWSYEKLLVNVSRHESTIHSHDGMGVLNETWPKLHVTYLYPSFGILSCSHKLQTLIHSPGNYYLNAVHSAIYIRVYTYLVCNRHPPFHLLVLVVGWVNHTSECSP